MSRRRWKPRRWPSKEVDFTFHTLTDDDRARYINIHRESKDATASNLAFAVLNVQSALDRAYGDMLHWSNMIRAEQAGIESYLLLNGDGLPATRSPE